MGKQYTDEELLAYKDKPISAVHERFADWLIDKLQIEFKPAKDATAAEALFRETVRVATVLRSIYQASPENQAARIEAREEREEAAAAKASKPSKAAKAAPKETPTPTKGKAAKATKTAPKTAPADEDEADTSAATPARKTAPKKAARSGSAAAPF